MPIWLRKFTISSMNEYHENQVQQMKKNENKAPKNIPKGPAVSKPTYSTKARK
jgi:hypothetical protein